MKYEYVLHTWGGFYNKEHKAIHKKESGYHYFDTKEERESFKEELEILSELLIATTLMTEESEGFNSRVHTVLHRICEYKGQKLHDEYDLGPNYEYRYARYHMIWKWYPGFNHYPFREQIEADYPELEYDSYFDVPGFKQLSQWITGAFEIEHED